MHFRLYRGRPAVCSFLRMKNPVGIAVNISINILNQIYYVTTSFDPEFEHFQATMQEHECVHSHY
jgi:hypothetical protein